MEARRSLEAALIEENNRSFTFDESREIAQGLKTTAIVKLPDEEPLKVSKPDKIPSAEDLIKGNVNKDLGSSRKTL